MRRISLLALLISFTTCYAQTNLLATDSTKQHNAAYLNELPFTNQQDFDDAQRGFIGRTEPLNLKSADGQSIWDMTPYLAFDNVGAATPSEVNPSLWRQSQLNTIYGLFKVTSHIYQVRGYDAANMTIIQGKTGYIIVDPLMSKETAAAAMDLVYKYLPKKPVVAVIYTHSHIDHFGGVKGVIHQADVDAGRVKVIAPDGFMESAISENVLAGNVMSRRASYMYGSFLPKSKEGVIDIGLAKGTSKGTLTLIPPTITIDHTGQTMTIDGVKFVFQYTPNSEAPSEMNFYLPQYKALCMAENATHTLHNLYTLRGAKVREAKGWAEYLNETLELFGNKTEVEFASHHWPMWGNANIVTFLQKQRDTYKYIHDQTLRMANEGYTMNEIANKLKLPDSLAHEWYNRGYYGSVSHDVKAVYQQYLGWYDGNPANLNPLPPVEASKKFVDYMGGAQAVLAKAQQDYDAGHYRWVAEVLNKVVFADPSNQKAKNLLADTYTQLAYQSENAPWRNVYLMGAQELRHGLQPSKADTTVSPDITRAMTVPMMLDYLSIKLNGPKAAGKTLSVNLIFPDVNEHYLVHLQNSVLSYTAGKSDAKADVWVTMNRKILNKLILNETTINDVIEHKQIQLKGDPQKLKILLGLFDKFDFWFNIVTP